MERTSVQLKSRDPVSWWWTAALFLISAALVASAGINLSKRTEITSLRPPGNSNDDTFRLVARRVDEMEMLWQKAVESEAERILNAGSQDAEISVTGVIQYSRLNPGLSDSSRSHRRADGSGASILPVLEKFARKDPNEWIFTENQILSGSGWIEMPDRPPAWWHGNGRAAVILLLDPARAADIVSADLKTRFPASSSLGKSGTTVWDTPSGTPWMINGKPADNAKPDEILRHVSRFGDWTLRRFYPARVVTSYRPPILAGSLTLSALLLACGAAVISWQRKATRLAEQRVSFVNRVSHELRTPLTNLLLNTDLALDELPVADEKIRRRLGLIREETARLSRIVDNVQTFARIERGKSEIHPTACDVEQLVCELRENFAPLFARKSIRCEFDFQLNREARVDRDALSQILSNLLSNIEKYAGESAQALVTIAANAGNLIVEVEDNGPGIPSEARTRVFLPFERAGSRVNEGATGTGLGLSISRDLAGQMGGRLELLTVSQGAKFRLVLPLGERSDT